MNVYNFPRVDADNARIFSIGFLDYRTKKRRKASALSGQFSIKKENEKETLTLKAL